MEDSFSAVSITHSCGSSQELALLAKLYRKNKMFLASHAGGPNKHRPPSTRPSRGSRAARSSRYTFRVSLSCAKECAKELCKGVHCVDLGESFRTHIFLQNLASIQPRTSPVKFARSSGAAWQPSRNGHGPRTSRVQPAGRPEGQGSFGTSFCKMSALRLSQR